MCWRQRCRFRRETPYSATVQTRSQNSNLNRDYRDRNSTRIAIKNLFVVMHTQPQHLVLFLEERQVVNFSNLTLCRCDPVDMATS